MMLRIWFSIQKFGKDRTVYLKEKKILISPTLNLNKVNFGAISCGAKRLGDVYQLASISTLNSLFQRDCVKDSAKKSIALFGGIDYDASISVNKRMFRTLRKQSWTEAVLIIYQKLLMRSLIYLICLPVS